MEKRLEIYKRLHEAKQNILEEIDATSISKEKKREREWTASIIHRAADFLVYKIMDPLMDEMIEEMNKMLNEIKKKKERKRVRCFRIINAVVPILSILVTIWIAVYFSSK